MLFYLQANSSIFVQSHTDFLNSTSSASSTQQSPTASQAKKTETCVGRWEQGSLIEPLHVSPAISNYAIKSENPGISHASGAIVPKPSKKQRVQPKVNKNINDCILSLHQQHQNNLVTTHPSSNNNLSILTTTTTTSTKEQLQGCSRTLPLAWTQPVQTGIVSTFK